MALLQLEIIFLSKSQSRERKTRQLNTMLMASNNIATVDEFLSTFQLKMEMSPAAEPATKNVPSGRGRVMPNPAAFQNPLPNRQQNTFAVQAVCEPHDTIVALNYHSASGSNDVIFPDCIKMKRCGGCCRPSELMACEPSQIIRKTINVMRWPAIPANGRNRGRQRAYATRMEIEEHLSCRCSCRVKADNCDAMTQRYDEQNCQCVCANYNEQRECLKQSELKFWSANECDCKCRNLRICSTGWIFSSLTCKCEDAHRLVNDNSTYRFFDYQQTDDF